MKKIISIILLVMILTLSACSHSLVYNNKRYKPYGLFNQSSVKSSEMCYDVVWGNVFWSAFLIHTIIFPVYFFGFDLYEPVGPCR